MVGLFCFIGCSMSHFIKLGLIFLTFSLASFVSSAEKSICGAFDDRERSHEATQTVVGIHTHGGCSENEGANSGTLLSTNKKFSQAVQECLAFESSLP